MNDKRSKIIGWPVIRWIIMAIGFLGIWIIGRKLLGEDSSVFFRWCLTITILGLVFFPVIGPIFSKFHDGGWLFSKTIGIAVSGWLMWYLSSIFLKFTRVNSIIVVAICLVINIVLCYVMIRYSKKKDLEPPFKINSDQIFSAVCSELLFFTVFLVWTYIRGFKPEAYGTEKFMDYGFMTAMMRAERMPPEDLWFAGQSINYYYIGQYLATYLTKLTGCTVNYGYNLMMMMLAAFSFVLPYSIVYNIAAVFDRDRSEKKKHSKVFCCFAGTIAGVAVSIAGNGHYPIYAWIKPWLEKISGKEVSSYWFPNATRYIGYNPETTDKTIHEFPSYSFVLGDLHAHVINIIFVLTVLALLFVFLQHRKKHMDDLRKRISVKEPVLLSEIFHPVIILIGFFIGIFQATNFWDFPIYFVVSGAVILFSNLVVWQFSKKALLVTALHAAVVFAVSIVVCLPFTISFKAMSTQIAFAQAKTPIYQLLVLWGLPVALVISYFVITVLRQRRESVFLKQTAAKQEVAQGMIAYQPKKCRLFQMIEAFSISDVMIITIGLCAIGLVLMPELVYVVDIYSGDFKRANTMFKLTYQAYIMFGLCFGFILAKFLCKPDKKRHRIYGIVLFVLWLTTVPYIKTACNSWFGDVTKPELYKGLDAAAFVENESSEDFEAIQWMNKTITGTPVILEANGNSYTYYQRVSVITGLPTVLGWETHEWLWRSYESEGYPESVAERKNDINTMYTSQDREEVLELLRKYKVEYIYVGGCEREKFGEELNEEILLSLGKLAYPENIQDADGLTTYVIKVAE